MKAHFIFYVHDQAKSCAFYRSVLDQEPTLDVDGMTEFHLNDGAVLGLMPETSIQRLLGNTIADPSLGHGIPCAELYLLVDDPGHSYQRALHAGARSLSPLELRDWGDTAAYCEDPDGYVIAFAKRVAS